MAVRMHKHVVLDRVFAPVGPPQDVVVVPPRHCGDLLVADRTDPFLLLPEQTQCPSTHQAPGHLHAETFLETNSAVEFGSCLRTVIGLFESGLACSWSSGGPCRLSMDFSLD